MTRMSEEIADFNEAHGITGVVINGQSLSNDDLRAIQPGNFGGYEWAQANLGRSFKRPNGTVVYTIKEIFAVRRGWQTFIQCVCDTPRGDRMMSWTELKSMERVP